MKQLLMAVLSIVAFTAKAQIYTSPDDGSISIGSTNSRGDKFNVATGGQFFRAGTWGIGITDSDWRNTLILSNNYTYHEICNNNGGPLVLQSAFGGKVGIGTNQPTEKLEIASGVLKIWNTAFGQYNNSSPRDYTNFGSDNHGSVIIGSNIYIENNTNGATYIRNAKTHPTMAGAGIIIPGNNQANQSSIIFHTSPVASANAETPYSSPRMIINAMGQVGIGTMNPTELLSVSGKIRAQEIKVEATNWPDYVFAKDYKLPALSEIEKHIQEKGHLPGIPSATDAEKNGISLSEMNAKLLQKIEELTLHLIAKDKELKEERAMVQNIYDRLKLLEEKQEKQKK